VISTCNFSSKCSKWTRVLVVYRYYTHCHYCLSRSYNLIPCPECPIAQYCSENCRSLAWEARHETECSILKLLRNLLNVDTDRIRMISKIIRLLIVVTENGTRIKELQQDMKTAESNSGTRAIAFKIYFCFVIIVGDGKGIFNKILVVSWLLNFNICSLVYF